MFLAGVVKVLVLATEVPFDCMEQPSQNSRVRFSRVLSQPECKCTKQATLAAPCRPLEIFTNLELLTIPGNELRVLPEGVFSMLLLK